MPVIDAGVRHTHVEDYVLLRKLGAHVYLGEHTMNGQQVAVKIVSVRSLAEKHKNTEVRVLATVGNHPSVAHVHSIVSTREHHFIIMELGQCDLASLINHNFAHAHAHAHAPTPPPLGLSCGWEYAKQLLEGIAHVHRRGIIHNDIKLTNCILGADGHVRLIDFGLSSFAASRVCDDTSEFCGTLGYMAPEILASRAHNTAADVWSFGVCLFVLLTGVFPFKHRTMADLLIDQENETYDDAQRFGFDAQTIEMFRRIFSPDPFKRPSAAQLLALPCFASTEPGVRVLAGAAGKQQQQQQQQGGESRPASVEGGVLWTKNLETLSKPQRAELTRMDRLLNQARARYLAKGQTIQHARTTCKRLAQEQSLQEYETLWRKENPTLKPSDFQEHRLSMRDAVQMQQHTRRLHRCSLSATDLYNAARGWTRTPRRASSTSPTCALEREIGAFKASIRTMRCSVQDAITSVKETQRVTMTAPAQQPWITEEWEEATLPALRRSKAVSSGKRHRAKLQPRTHTQQTHTHRLPRLSVPIPNAGMDYITQQTKESGANVWRVACT